MRRKLKCLDLFCGAGGAAIGLLEVFDTVVGVDIEPQPRYPGEFVRMDAMTLLRNWNDIAKGRVLGHVLRDFDFIWASPPCQAFTRLKTAHNAKEHIDLLTPSRPLLKKTGKPYCIENVVGAPLRDPVWLRGTMFGLGAEVDGVFFQLDRERGFEATFPIPVPADKFTKSLPVVGIYGGHARNRSKEWGGRGTRDFPGHSQRDIASRALDIDGMTLLEMSQVIPPAFSEHIARAWLRSQGKTNAAA